MAYAACRISSVGSLLGVWSFAAIATALGELDGPYLILSLVTATLVTWRHRDNIRRLVRGEEMASPPASRRSS